MTIDRQHAETIPEAERCRCCDGTGNMLLSMYRKCLACDGDGRSRGPDAERQANLYFDLLYAKPSPQNIDWCANVGRWDNTREPPPPDGQFHRECGGNVIFTGHSLKCEQCGVEQFPLSESGE